MTYTYSVGFSVIKEVRYESTWDLDYILITGNSLCSSLAYRSKLLSADLLFSGDKREQFSHNCNQFNANNFGNGLILINSNSAFQSYAEAYSEPSQTSKMKLCVKTVNG